MKTEYVQESLNIHDFFKFKPKIIPKLFFSAKGVISPESQKAIFQSLLISHSIIKQEKNNLCCIDHAEFFI